MCDGLTTLDLLDANEWTWAFMCVDRVGVVSNRQVRRLTALAI